MTSEFLYIHGQRKVDKLSRKRRKLLGTVKTIYVFKAKGTLRRLKRRRWRDFGKRVKV